MQCVVADFGSGSTKVQLRTVVLVSESPFVRTQVGFAGEDAPHNVFPSVMAKSRAGDNKGAQFFGSDVHKQVRALEFHHSRAIFDRATFAVQTGQ